ncbi:hypothetical protein WJX84_009113 [Apatococcus fuscideae]|uniref:Uncharacterized protein n=1 Tax=Apatococcus fuscideae TaxID=2026836 RepID=A0AAW1SNI3_9CHLO
MTSAGAQRGRPLAKGPLSPQNRQSSRSSSRPPEPPAWYPGEGQAFSPPAGGPIPMGPVPMQGPTQMGYGWVPGNGMPPPQHGYPMMPGQPPMMFMGPRGPFAPGPGQAYMVPGYGLVMPHPMQVAMAQGRGPPMFPQPGMMGPPGHPGMPHPGAMQLPMGDPRMQGMEGPGAMPGGPPDPRFELQGMPPGQQGPPLPLHQDQGPPRGPPIGPPPGTFGLEQPPSSSPPRGPKVPNGGPPKAQTTAHQRGSGRLPENAGRSE